MRGSTRTALSIALAAFGLVGCNAILGIEEPTESASTGAAGSAIVTTTSGGSGGTGSAGTMSPTGPVHDAGPVDPTAFNWAEWPMPNPASLGLPNAQSYDTTSFAGVVLDSITGLQWQRTVDQASYTLADALTFCAGLTLTGGGWRVPSRIELLSLVDYTNANPVIDTNAFPDTPSDLFWTSSASASDPTFAWHVNFKFNDGMADQSSKTTTHRVRCVR